MPAVGEGSEFSDPLHLTFFKVGMILLSGLLLYPILWLSGRYVLSIHKQEHDEAIEVEIWSLLGNHNRYRIHLENGTSEKNIQYHKGKLQLPLKPHVMAPWYAVRLKGHRKWVIDAQGDFPHGEDELADLFAQLD
jgi:hypothetical protein